jgi:hypothetical protein
MCISYITPLCNAFLHKLIKSVDVYTKPQDSLLCSQQLDNAPPTGLGEPALHVPSPLLQDQNLTLLPSSFHLSCGLFPLHLKIFIPCVINVLHISCFLLEHPNIMKRRKQIMKLIIQLFLLAFYHMASSKFKKSSITFCFHIPKY